MADTPPGDDANETDSGEQPPAQPAAGQPEKNKEQPGYKPSRHEQRLGKLEERKAEREQDKKEWEKRQARKKWMSRALVGVVILIIAGVGYGAFTIISSSDNGTFFGLLLPKIGDHWHASYSITLCGERMPTLAEIPGEVHSHGDNIIHVHPKTVERAGVNANLKNFLEFYGGELTNQSVQFPGRDLLTNGDSCLNSTAPGRLQILINNKEHELAERYVMQDGDTISVVFE